VSFSTVSSQCTELLSSDNVGRSREIFPTDLPTPQHLELSQPGFVHPNAIARMASEVNDLPNAFHHFGDNGLDAVYPVARRPLRYASDEAVGVLPPSHPLRRSSKQDTLSIASDQIPAGSLLRQLYDAQLMTDFIAAVVCKKGATADSPAPAPLYQFADEFQALNVIYYDTGGARAWHYDGSDVG